MLWAYAVMVLVAGLTALYTARCLWMVFYGPRHDEKHVHDAGPAMRVALIPLALGTVVTWLLADPFLRLLETVPSFHGLLGKVESGWEVLVEIITAPATFLALGVIGLGLLTWQFRKNLGWISQGLKGISKIAEGGFGFEAINRGIVQGRAIRGRNLARHTNWHAQLEYRGPGRGFCDRADRADPGRVIE